MHHKQQHHVDFEGEIQGTFEMFSLRRTSLEHFVDLKLQLYFFRPTSATFPLSVQGIDVHEA